LCLLLRCAGHLACMPLTHFLSFDSRTASNRKQSTKGDIVVTHTSRVASISKLTRDKEREKECQVKFVVLECHASGINANREQRGNLCGSIGSPNSTGFPSAGSRSGCLYSSLGCYPISLIRVSLGWFDYSKKCEEGQPNSGLFASERSKTPHGPC
jgi:hypothetical protein